MVSNSKLRLIGSIFGLLWLCSCATTHAPAPVPAVELPAAVTLNRKAGFGDLVIVSLRFQDGEEVPFVMDTGCPATVLDKSLEPKLGKSLDTGTFWNFGNKLESSGYAMPRLYLGRTALVFSNPRIATADFKKLHVASFEGGSVRGILGMDCLQHYCVQLDFKARQVRFLKPGQVNAARLGNAFPLTFSSQGQSEEEYICPFISRGTLIGGKGAELLVDTGCDVDGGMKPQLLERAIQEKKATLMDNGNARFLECAWDGQTYNDIMVRTWPRDVAEPNLVGLRFLARHLVTFDFPNRMLYLKRTSVEPLVDKEVAVAAKAAAGTAAKFIKKLQQSGQLPGWSKKDEITSDDVHFYFNYPNSISCDHLEKKGDASIYHYDFTRESTSGPWRLLKAWRTDQNDRTLEEYPVP